MGAGRGGVGIEKLERQTDRQMDKSTFSEVSAVCGGPWLYVLLPFTAHIMGLQYNDITMNQPMEHHFQAIDCTIELVSRASPSREAESLDTLRRLTCGRK